MVSYDFEFVESINPSIVFTTDNALRYLVEFKDSSYIFDGYLPKKVPVYEMGIEIAYNPNAHRPPLDSRIAVTIASIFRDFFSRDNKQSIIYICDSSDSRQAARHRKFSHWLELFGKEFVQLDAQIGDKETIYYTSLILHAQNPQRLAITDAFYNLIANQQK